MKLSSVSISSAASTVSVAFPRIFCHVRPETPGLTRSPLCPASVHSERCVTPRVRPAPHPCQSTRCRERSSRTLLTKAMEQGVRAPAASSPRAGPSAPGQRREPGQGRAGAAAALCRRGSLPSAAAHPLTPRRSHCENCCFFSSGASQEEPAAFPDPFPQFTGLSQAEPLSTAEYS